MRAQPPRFRAAGRSRVDRNFSFIPRSCRPLRYFASDGVYPVPVDSENTPSADRRAWQDMGARWLLVFLTGTWVRVYCVGIWFSVLRCCPFLGHVLPSLFSYFPSVFIGLSHSTSREAMSDSWLQLQIVPALLAHRNQSEMWSEITEFSYTFQRKGMLLPRVSRECRNHREEEPQCST